ncbi:MAG TPA: 3'(2'),5'-bisphosphate nucleotidase CysQ [Candidatus Saccharimonadales bacterium]|nr:3'(2'),5'-bisphosphate nucleotidase CysQ [Candidatus Saccharimonadales bacterium]
MTDDQLQAVIEVVRRAGAVLMEEFGSDELGAETKPDGSPVLRADKRSSALLEAELPKVIDVPVLSEENEHRELSADAPYFIIDPLDGTKEFMRGSHDFAINVAFMEGGLPTAGVVYGPARNELYYARQGQGAFRIRGSETEAIHVSDRQRELIGIMSFSHASERDTELLDKLGCTSTIRMGSVLKFCAVASGAADIYMRSGRTMIWDTAAADIVVREAGGHMLYYTGDRLSADFNLSLANDGFLCSNIDINPSDVAQYFGGQA